MQQVPRDVAGKFYIDRRCWMFLSWESCAVHMFQLLQLLLLLQVSRRY